MKNRLRKLIPLQQLKILRSVRRIQTLVERIMNGELSVLAPVICVALAKEMFLLRYITNTLAESFWRHSGFYPCFICVQSVAKMFYLPDNVPPEILRSRALR